MKKYILAIIILLSASVSNAQFQVSINSNQFIDTVKTCSDTSITYYAYGIYEDDTIPDMNYRWDFDDGNILTGTELDTVNHQYIVDYEYNTQQFYRIIVTVWNDTLWGYNILPIKIGINPWFTNTKADISSDQDGICKGEETTLLGKYSTHKWKEKRQNIRTEVFSQYIDYNNSYSSYITLRHFDIPQTIEQVTDFDSIGLKLEHSNTANVRITLTCPTGQMVVLKDTGGVEKAFGESVIEVGDYSEGLGYWYYWSAYPLYGTMNTYSGTADTLPSATYKSDSLLSKFIGCPINGNWTINVSDSTDDDNDGYGFAWALYFNEDIETDTIEFFNTYDDIIWNGDEIGFTDGLGNSSAEPEIYGEQEYIFMLNDNYGCPHDTSVYVLVEKPVFEVDKESMFIGDSVKLDDKTTWTKQWSWDYGDDSDFGTEQTEYKIYEDKGSFEIILTATSESGCKDYDTVEIVVNPKPISIEGYNVFTPNGDGVNDVFSFFNTPDEKIIAANIEKVNGKIYNRYGAVVCKWDSPEEMIEGWDGTIKNRGGREAPPGFYYYILIITGKDEIKYKDPYFSGVIYLYRSK